MATQDFDKWRLNFQSIDFSGIIFSRPDMVSRKEGELKDPAMEVKNLTAWYDGKINQPAIDSISFQIPKRSITALIGSSGCGKSTLLRCLNRIHEIKPGAKASGEVLLDGENIYGRSADVVDIRRRVGMIFQKPNPFPKSSYDNIAYGPRLYGIRKKADLDKIVEQSLIKAALWDEIKDKLHQNALSLSGGQQQRLCIARTLAVEPEVILMDEPCSSLDPISTYKIEELMQDLKNSFAVVIVTHNLQQAARVAHHVGYLEAIDNQPGKLIEFGEVSKILLNPQNLRTENYLRGKPN